MEPQDIINQILLSFRGSTDKLTILKSSLNICLQAVQILESQIQTFDREECVEIAKLKLLKQNDSPKPDWSTLFHSDVLYDVCDFLTDIQIIRFSQLNKGLYLGLKGCPLKFDVCRNQMMSRLNELSKLRINKLTTASSIHTSCDCNASRFQNTMTKEFPDSSPVYELVLKGSTRDVAMLNIREAYSSREATLKEELVRRTYMAELNAAALKEANLRAELAAAASADKVAAAAREGALAAELAGVRAASDCHQEYGQKMLQLQAEFLDFLKVDFCQQRQHQIQAQAEFLDFLKVDFCQQRQHQMQMELERQPVSSSTSSSPSSSSSSISTVLPPTGPEIKLKEKLNKKRQELIEAMALGEEVFIVSLNSRIDQLVEELKQLIQTRLMICEEMINSQYTLNLMERLKVLLKQSSDEEEPVIKLLYEDHMNKLRQAIKIKIDESDL